MGKSRGGRAKGKRAAQGCKQGAKSDIWEGNQANAPSSALFWAPLLNCPRLPITEGHTKIESSVQKSSSLTRICSSPHTNPSITQTAIVPFGQNIEGSSLTVTAGDSPVTNQCLSQASSFTSWFPTHSFSKQEKLIFFPEKQMLISFFCFLLNLLFLLHHPPQSVSSLDDFRG